tara:strand:+ start:543 stop:887 length:345 start_codon:yes stop_codon:yes gene_type:complete
MDTQIYFTIGKLFFTINMIFLLRPVILSFFGGKNLLQVLSQIFKIIFGIVKGIFTVIFTGRIYFKPYSETSLKFEDIYQNQILWLGGGNKKKGHIINLSLIAMMIIPFLLGLFS